MLKITFSDGKTYSIETLNIAHEKPANLAQLDEAKERVLGAAEKPEDVRGHHIKNYLDSQAKEGFIEVAPCKFYAISAIVSVEVVDAHMEKEREETQAEAKRQAEERHRLSMRAAATVSPVLVDL